MTQLNILAFLVFLLVLWHSLECSMIQSMAPTTPNPGSRRSIADKSIDLVTHEEEDYEDEVGGVRRPSGDLVYDEDEEVSNDEEDEDQERAQPYACPFNCRCKFNKATPPSQETSDDEYDDIERFRIEVECPNAALDSLINLFDEDFPLGQIVFL